MKNLLIKNKWISIPALVVMLLSIFQIIRVIFIERAGMSIWSPDSRYYLYFTLRTIGNSPAEAKEMVFDIFIPLKGGYLMDYGMNLVRPRIAMYGLAAPLTYLFGTTGFLWFSPILFVLTNIIFYKFLSHFVNWKLAFALTTAYILMPRSAYMILPLTESLTMFAMILWLYALPWHYNVRKIEVALARAKESKQRTSALMAHARYLIPIFVATILVGLTRQLSPHLVFIGGMLTALMYVWRRDDFKYWLRSFASMFVAATAAAVWVMLTGKNSFTHNIKANSGVKTNAELWTKYPAQMGEVLWTELQRLLTDNILLGITIICISGAIVYFRKQPLIWVLTVINLICFLLSVALNPAVANLRYLLPTVHLLFLAAGLAISEYWKNYQEKAHDASTNTDESLTKQDTVSNVDQIDTVDKVNVTTGSKSASA